MPGTMKPAILFLEIPDIFTFTFDGISVEVVHTEYEGNTKQDDSEVCLVVKFEEKIIMKDRVSSEQILQFPSANDLVHVFWSVCRVRLRASCV